MGEHLYRNLECDGSKTSLEARGADPPMERYHLNILGLCEMRWKNFGEMSSDDRHKVHFSGERDRYEYWVDFLVHKTP